MVTGNILLILMKGNTEGKKDEKQDFISFTDGKSRIR